MRRMQNPLASSDKFGSAVVTSAAKYKTDDNNDDDDYLSANNADWLIGTTITEFQHVSFVMLVKLASTTRHVVFTRRIWRLAAEIFAWQSGKVNSH